VTWALPRAKSPGRTQTWELNGNGLHLARRRKQAWPLRAHRADPGACSALLDRAAPLPRITPSAADAEVHTEGAAE